MDAFYAQLIEREVEKLVQNQSLADTEDIDPITVLSISNSLVFNEPAVSHVKTVEEFSDVLRDPSHANFSLRIYFMHQSNSLSTMNITPALLAQLLAAHRFMPELTKTLHGFRFTRHEGNTSEVLPFQKKTSQERTEYVYAIRSAEFQGRSDYEPWSVRHYALYHGYHHYRNESVGIIVSPRRQSRFETRILEYLRNKENIALLASHRSWMDELLCSTCMEGWKAYMDFYEAKLEAVAAKLSSRNAESNLSHRPSDLFFLESRFLRIVPAISAIKNVMLHLRGLYDHQRSAFCETEPRNDIIRSFHETTATHENQLDAFQQRLEVLLKERESTAHLLEQMISFKNQRVSQEQNNLLTSLTQSTVDDSVNVRVITVIGLVYVSSTVVADIMDTPFFLVDENGHLQVSQQLWIYVVVVIPLTALTLLFWRWERQRRTKNRILSHQAGDGNSPV